MALKGFGQVSTTKGGSNWCNSRSSQLQLDQESAVPSQRQRTML